MCLIVFAWRQHPSASLLLAANRDEFYERPTKAAAYWSDAPQVLAGRDLQAGGTWLGVSHSGRFAAITNIRDPAAEDGQALRSRGELTTDFLTDTQGPGDYLADVARRRGEYQGFNLLVGDQEGLWYLHGNSDERSEPQALAPGIYGLSNAALDVPWPKVQRARHRLRDAMTNTQLPDHEALRACLNDRSLADPESLEKQNLFGTMARQLSAQFIVTPRYGTRCCTTLRQHADGALEFQEQRFDSRGELQGTEVFALNTRSKA
ncbi:NRDE family protein [Congregibacter sp.]|uniref:NRDE family protein n=1 Tax=Congregibacter sp. TaxID=2744308 RepID=UPI003F6D4482